MIRVERVVGSVAHGFVLPADTETDELWLTRWEAQRRRLRKRTLGNRDIAIALADQVPVADGDVLFTDTEVAVVARVERGTVVVFRLDTQLGAQRDAHGAAQDVVVNALRFGHVLGNQHWPLRLRAVEQAGNGLAALEVVVPLSLDPLVVNAVIRAHRLEGVTYTMCEAAGTETLDPPPPPVAHTDDHAYPHARPHRHAAAHAAANGDVLEHSHH